MNKETISMSNLHDVLNDTVQRITNTLPEDEDGAFYDSLYNALEDAAVTQLGEYLDTSE